MHQIGTKRNDNNYFTALNDFHKFSIYKVSSTRNTWRNQHKKLRHFIFFISNVFLGSIYNHHNISKYKMYFVWPCFSDVSVESPCCQNKTVGESNYQLVDKISQVYENCKDGCVYKKAGDTSDTNYCFAVGNQQVKCHESFYGEYISTATATCRLNFL